MPELKGIRTHEDSLLLEETTEVDLAVREPWDVEGEPLDPEELLTFLVEGLPRTPTAKIQKHLLRTEGVTTDTYDRDKSGFKVKREKLTDT